MPNNDSIAVSRHMMVDRGNYATVAAYIYIYIYIPMCMCTKLGYTHDYRFKVACTHRIIYIYKRTLIGSKTQDIYIYISNRTLIGYIYIYIYISYLIVTILFKTRI